MCELKENESTINWEGKLGHLDIERWGKNAQEPLVRTFLGCSLWKYTLEIKVHKEMITEGGKV